jgi:hypothetical protein
MDNLDSFIKDQTTENNLFPEIFYEDLNNSINSNIFQFMESLKLLDEKIFLLISDLNRVKMQKNKLTVQKLHNKFVFKKYYYFPGNGRWGTKYVPIDKINYSLLDIYKTPKYKELLDLLKSSIVYRNNKYTDLKKMMTKDFDYLPMETFINKLKRFEQKYT